MASRAEREAEIARMIAEASAAQAAPEPAPNPKADPSPIYDPNPNPNPNPSSDPNPHPSLEPEPRRVARRLPPGVLDAEEHLVRGGAGHKSLRGRSAADLALMYTVPVAQAVMLNRVADGSRGIGVTCISTEASGSRVAVGAKDGKLRLYDFGGMDSSHRPFKVLVPESGCIPVDVAHGAAGAGTRGRFVVAPGSSACGVYSRDGDLAVECTKGDMYIKDQGNTKGHTNRVRAVRWRPQSASEVLTAAADGTARLWDVDGGPVSVWQKLETHAIIKVKTAEGTPVPASALAAAADGNVVAVGAIDGAVKLYDIRDGFGRAAKPRISLAHVPGGGRRAQGTGYVVTAAAWVPGNEYKLLTRAQDHAVKFWDVRKASAPTKVLDGVYTPTETCGITFSPDGRVVLLPVAAMPRSDNPGELRFYDLLGKDTRPLLRYAYDDLKIGTGVACWNGAIKQILVGLEDGRSQVLFHPALSENGALLSSVKRVRAARDTDIQFGSGVGDVRTPALEAEENRRKRGPGPMVSKRDARKAKLRPTMPQNGPHAILSEERHKGVGLAHMFMQDKKDEINVRKQDPREALLKYQGQGGHIVDDIYNEAAPEFRMDNTTLEQAEEDFKEAQRKILEQDQG